MSTNSLATRSVTARWRTFFVPVLLLALLTVAACASMPTGDERVDQVRSALPLGYDAHMVVYKAGGEQGYEIRSLSRGAKDPCSNGYESWQDTKFGRIRIRNCSAADSAFVDSLARKLEVVVQIVEAAFGRQIHIDEARISLVDVDFGFDSTYAHGDADPMHLAYVVTQHYESVGPDYSLRGISTNSAHELFHLARFVLGRDGNGKGKDGLDEEGKAALFAKCVESRLFGNIASYQVGSDGLAPDAVTSSSDLHGSAAGAQAAERLLAPYFDPKNIPTSAAMKARFNDLCNHVSD